VTLAPSSTGVASPGVGSAEFRAALRRHPAGVAVVTSAEVTRPAGLTVTSFTSVSLEPPLVAFCIAEKSSAWPALRAAAAFSVHLLERGQAHVAERFAGPAEGRFGPDTDWSWDAVGLPELAGFRARLSCEVAGRVALGDHVLVTGLVHRVQLGEAFAPLIHHDGGFCALGR
jgi:flavin reductase (DIM6/NTAB) family NADH-FMN oxidoreductase RutF